MEASSGRESPDDRFREYARTGDRRVREELILEHRDLARRGLARRYRGRGESLDDLDQVALVGLVKAVERFDASRGVAFSTFAVPTITGELKRHFRGQWMVRVPRSVQERVLELARTIEELTTREGRSPTLAELSAAMGEPEETLLEAMDARQAFSAVALDVPGPESGGEAPSGWLSQPDELLGTVERRLLAESLLERLGSREQLILRLRFFDELTQSEIALRVGLSQMQVSRLIRHSIEKLRVLAAT